MNAPAKKKYVTWEEAQKLCYKLGEKLKPLVEKDPNIGLIAITRGGLVPTANLAACLDIRLIDTVCMSSYSGIDQAETMTLIKKASVAGHNWIIVDDLVDSGKTMKFARELMPEAHTCAIYAKPMGKPLVHTYMEDVPQDEWIMFPWELYDFE